MRRLLALSVLLLAGLAFAAAGLADPGDKGKAKGKANKRTFTVATTDNGTCNNEWAALALRRTFHVKKNRDGTFRLTRRDRGTFTTVAGQSPGACDTTGKHGALVTAGIKGKIVGSLRGTITGGTYNPDATCTGPDCGFTDVFITTFFGPAAKFSCFEGGACKFNYNYTAPKKKTQELKFRHWQDKGSGTEEEFKGDIATS